MYAVGKRWPTWYARCPAIVNARDAARVKQFDSIYSIYIYNKNFADLFFSEHAMPNGPANRCLIFKCEKGRYLCETRHAVKRDNESIFPAESCLIFNK